MSISSKIPIVIASLVVIGFTGLGIHNIASTGNKIKLREIELKDTATELKQLQIKYDILDQEIDKERHQKNINKEKVEDLEKEKENLQKQKEELERQVSAKREAARLASNSIQDASDLSGTAYAGGGSKDQWLAASGIPKSQWWAVDYIVSRESGWDPCAYNPGRSDCNANPSSACGLAQSLPCGKQSKYGHWTDPVANLKWQYEYVEGRYGGYPQAVEYWKVNRHY